MKRFSLVFLAVLLALTTVLVSSCAAPPEENAGNGNNVGNGGTEDGTDESTEPPEETEPESTADEGTEKDEESALPEDSDSSNDETSAEDAPEPDDTDADVPPETEPVAPPETEPVAPPSEELLVLIENDYSAFCNSDGRSYLTRYYGEYSGCVPVMFLEPIPGVIMDIDIEVAGSVFHYTDPIEITVWKDGEFFTLQEAYDQNLLTKEQIATIASIHSSGEFVPLNRY